MVGRLVAGVWASTAETETRNSDCTGLSTKQGTHGRGAGSKTETRYKEEEGNACLIKTEAAPGWAAEVPQRAGCPTPSTAVGSDTKTSLGKVSTLGVAPGTSWKAWIWGTGSVW